MGRQLEPVPERRPPRALRTNQPGARPVFTTERSSFPLPVWRCKVCGYLCARDLPPGICPICKAKQDRFERFA